MFTRHLELKHKDDAGKDLKINREVVKKFATLFGEDNIGKNPILREEKDFDPQQITEQVSDTSVIQCGLMIRSPSVQKSLLVPPALGSLTLKYAFHENSAV